VPHFSSISLTLDRLEEIVASRFLVGDPPELPPFKASFPRSNSGNPACGSEVKLALSGFKPRKWTVFYVGGNGRAAQVLSTAASHLFALFAMNCADEMRRDETIDTRESWIDLFLSGTNSNINISHPKAK
jgi:hypothetical protein